MVKIEVIGRLGSDAETKQGKKGDFLTFRLAADEYSRGEKSTAWFNVLYGGNLVSVIQQYLTKGKLVYIVGKERVSTYVNKTNETVISREILADTIEFISTGSSQQEGGEAKTKIADKVDVPKPEELADTKPFVTNTADDVDDLPF